MPQVFPTRRTTGLEAMSKSLGSLLDTITEIKQRRGRQQLNDAVMQALSQPGTPDERRTGAFDAVSGVRNQQQGAGGILGGIMNMFNPAVATFAGTAPIEEILTGTMVRDLTTRSRYSNAQAQGQSRAQAEWWKNQKLVSDSMAAISKHTMDAKTALQPIDEKFIAFHEGNKKTAMANMARIQSIVNPQAVAEQAAREQFGQQLASGKGSIPSLDAELTEGIETPQLPQAPTATLGQQPVRDITGLTPQGPPAELRIEPTPATPQTITKVQNLVRLFEEDAPGIISLMDTDQPDVIKILAAYDSGDLDYEAAIGIFKNWPGR